MLKLSKKLLKIALPAFVGIFALFYLMKSQKRQAKMPSRKYTLEIDTSASEAADIRLALFSAVVSFVNNEAQLIWNRYNVMLAANSFIAVLLGAVIALRPPTATDAVIVLTGSIVGLCLSWQWKGLTTRGWELEHYWVKYAETFRWEGIKNPLDPYSEWCKKTGRGEGLSDWISLYAHRVIWLFIICYLLAIAVSLTILAYVFFTKHWL